MNKETIFAASIWAIIIGSVMFHELTLPIQNLATGRQPPWQIVVLPLFVIFGALMGPDFSGNFSSRISINNKYGYEFCGAVIEKIMPELLLATMSSSISITGLARIFIFNKPSEPPSIIAFFASSSFAFIVAYFIRRHREKI